MKRIPAAIGLLVVAITVTLWGQTSDTWTCSVEGAVGKYADGSQKLSMVRCSPATPAIKKGDKVTITRVNQALVPTTNPAPRPSPDGTKAVSVVYGGATWTFGANKETLRNGVHVANGYGVTYKVVSGELWVQAPAPGGAPGAWYFWDGSGWPRSQSNEPGTTAPPTPTPTSTPTPVPSPGGVRQMVGGCIGHEEWSSGRIAIDFATNRLWVVGHDQVLNVYEYRLTDCNGTGGDPSTWPVIQPVRMIPKWWENVEGSGTYAGGLAFFRGKLWVAPKVMYAASPVQGAGPLTLYAPDGDRINLTLPRQKFSGFVKRAGQEPLIGGGGYASGQGSVSGPTLATMAGRVLLSYEWPPLPGAKLEFWNQRAPREPNYFVEGHGDSWVGWEPRTINGVRQGRWASDGIEGGGLLLPDGLKYWPLMGTGELKYSYQSIGFAAQGNVASYEYTYDPKTFQFQNYKPFAGAWVKGQEVGPDGTVYLAQRWLRGNYIAITIWR
jgi:hypothetical protein